MTVGIGFSCEGGVVLCADSQITKEGGLKYNEKKIYTINGCHPSGPDYHGITLCYAGDPDIMKLLCEQIDIEISQSCPPEDWSERDDGTWNDMFRGVVEQKLRDIYKMHGAKEHQLELLCAIFSKKVGVSLYCARGRIVRSSDSAECIGVGDSSVLRFLADLFVAPRITIPQALTLGCYMVAKARTYIAGSGGPTQAFFMTHKGKFRNLGDIFRDGIAPDDGLEKTERAVVDLICKLTAKKLSKEANDSAVREFRGRISDIEINWPRLLGYKNENYFDE